MMGLFDTGDQLTNLETKEIQAQLVGLCHKVIARQALFSGDADKYEKLIAELTRRNIKPQMTLQPKEGGK